ncbi:MAG: hypothetical protein K9L17_03460 [Clostridiales bacterium]|nr:hypothetical protein [Clostridiales bacterium]MCF8021737.1 hypothetical protein [Clostridiales bacterium]
MMIDHELVIKKVSYIREQAASIEKLFESKSKQDILYDLWIIRGLKYALQTMIEDIEAAAFF